MLFNNVKSILLVARKFHFDNENGFSAKWICHILSVFIVCTHEKVCDCERQTNPLGEAPFDSPFGTIIAIQLTKGWQAKRKTNDEYTVCSLSMTVFFNYMQHLMNSSLSYFSWPFHSGYCVSVSRRWFSIVLCSPFSFAFLINVLRFRVQFYSVEMY